MKTESGQYGVVMEIGADEKKGMFIVVKQKI